MRTILAVVTPVLVSAPAAFAAPAAPLEPGFVAEHEDNRLGFAIKPPKKWTEIPVQNSEAWIVGKYLSKKTYRTVVEGGYTAEMQAEMRCIAFIDPAQIKDDEDDGDDEVTIDFEDLPEWASPYQDYRDFLERTFPQGFYESRDPEHFDHDGTPVESMEFKVEKLSVPTRIYAWVFDCEWGKLAIDFVLFEDEFDKERRDFDRALKSFERIERTEPLNLDQGSAGRFSITFLESLDPAGRKIKRQEAERLAFEQAKANLPDDWDAEEIKGYNVLIHSDKKHAKKVVDHVIAVRGWLEENFSEFGEGEYATRPLIRTCANIDEENSFRSGTSFLSSREIVTHKSMSGATSYEWQYVNARTMHMWFQDRDSSCYFAMPGWLKFGLEEIIEDAEPKGKKLEFKSKDIARIAEREIEKGDGPLALRDLFSMSEDEIRALREQGNNKPYFQAVSLVLFLVDGPGAKNKDTKDILPDYLRNLHAVLTELDNEDEESGEKEKEAEPQTEEEEEELMRKRRERLQERREMILDRVLEKTFAGWDDSDWSRFQKAFEKSL